MQGSRWTLTATQTNGWCGPVKVRPDQMQIMNPIMILAFLPIFQYGVYPLIEKCGIRVGFVNIVIVVTQYITHGLWVKRKVSQNYFKPIKITFNAI